VPSILDDDKNSSPFDLKKQERDGLHEILERNNVCIVPFSGCERIDSKEKDGRAADQQA
jgi:adrenodoxin-NADP+ reductase